MGSKLTEKSILTPIQSFYAGQTVFLTGATGFLGKLVLKKLLKDCFDVKKIYLLVRPKRGIDEKKRLETLFDSLVFDEIKSQKPDFKAKICLIEGDLTEPMLGISEDDQKLLKTEVTCIFHLAATVKFNEKLRTATYINVRALRDLIEMAKQMKTLRAFVHVSTAFSHCTREYIDEKVYKTVIEPNKLLHLVEIMDDDILDSITPIILGETPNTYCLTKGIAEHLVEDAKECLPVVIVRPSIVISSCKEPFEGWTDNVYGMNGIALGAALGVLRSIRVDKHNKSDLIPADIVVNCIIASAWDLEHSRKKAIQKPVENNSRTVPELTVFNCVTSVQNPITWGGLTRFLELHGPEYASDRCIWYYCFILIKSAFWYNFMVFFLHTVPAHIVDLVLRIIGKEPMLVKGYEKIKKHTDALAYFGLREWKWSNKNVQKMHSTLSSKDKELFYFDVKQIDWSAMAKSMMSGGRKFLLKDTEDTIPAAKRRYLFLRAIHYLLITFLIYLAYKLVSYVVRRVIM